MDYTSSTLVAAYGNMQNPDTDRLDGMVTAYSAGVDKFCHQVFGQATYTDQVRPGHIDRDGVLMCYAPVPTMAAPTAFRWRYGRIATYTPITLSLLDVEERRDGCLVRVLDSDYRDYRGQRLQVSLSYVGGWADLNAVPADFEMAVRRLVWWAYKLPEAPMNKTAMPALGQVVIPPSGWPRDVREALRPYVRYIN